jgi:DNA invertase Pin-like site-specific DNA recombinase
MIINDLQNMKFNPKAERRYYVAYLRKSSESEDRQVQSIDDQRNVITPLAKEKNLEILETFEESRSAKAPGRTEFDRMIATIRNRDDIKGIISWKLNRISRNPVETGALQWLLQEKKID